MGLSQTRAPQKVYNKSTNPYYLVGLQHLVAMYSKYSGRGPNQRIQHKSIYWCLLDFFFNYKGAMVIAPFPDPKLVRIKKVERSSPDMIIQNTKYASTVAQVCIGPDWHFVYSLLVFFPVMPHARALLQLTWHLERSSFKWKQMKEPPLHAFALHYMTPDTKEPSSCGHKCQHRYLMWNTEGVADKVVFPHCT